MKLKLKILLLSILIFSGWQSNSFSQFGKNKVQYQDFDWKYIESKNFDVYYNDGSKYLATYSAIKAEEALAIIQKQLNFKINKRIVFVVYDTHNEFQQTNVISSFMPEGVGGVTELFKNRVVVPFQGTYAQLRHVIHHELIHAVLNDLLYGGTFQSSVSAGRQIDFPIWMNEGLAEWSSIGGMNTHTDMFMRDLTISELLPPLQYLGGYLSYRAGQTFYWYIADKYGDARVGDLVNRMRLSPSIDVAFKSTFNIGLKEFSEQWEKDLKKYYWTDLDIFDSPEDFSVELTDHKEEGNFYNSSPTISPDGEKMAFISDRDGTFSIFVQDLNNREKIEEIVSSFREQDFEDLNLLTPGISWNPDGSKIVVSAKSGGEDALFIVDALSGDYDKLTFGIKSISSVEWSPDGNSLAFIGTKGPQSDIYVYKIDKDRLVNITDDLFSDMEPVWSNDSETIYFISDREDNIKNTQNLNFNMWDINPDFTDLYKINVGTKIIERLTYDPEYQKTSLAISSDNSKLLFVSDKNGIGNIYQLNLQTGEIQPKTNSLNGITQLSLAKDESKLLFSVLINGGYDIYMIRYPFDKELEMRELPLTKLREKAMEEKKITENLIKDIDNSENDEDFISYGPFDISFDNQQVVKPNYDAIMQDPGLLADGNSGDRYTDTIFVEKDYKVEFSPDVVLGNPGYSTYWGFQGVTQMLFSDVMGDHQMYLQANLLLDLRNSSFLFSYYYLPKVIDYTLSAYHSAGFVYLWDDANIVQRPVRSLYRFRNWGASIFSAYPFDMFNRVEWGLSWMNISKEDINDPKSLNNVSRSIIVPEGRYVHDDVLWGYYAPVKGTRYSVGFKGSPKFSQSGIGFMTIEADVRHYIPLGDFLNFAFRYSGGGSFGPNPQKFFIGGTENWINPTFVDNTLPFNDPEDFAFMEFKMPMRGYSISEVIGNKYFLTNFELRFPLFRALLAGPIPILFQSIMGAAFFDMGGAWNDDFRSTATDISGRLYYRDLMMSAGIGVRTYLLGLPLKLDIAWRNDYNSWSQPIYMISLGMDY